MCHSVLLVLSTILLVISAHDTDWNPAAEDERILKQPPHHWGTPAPDSRLKLDFVPFRMLASVRREENTQHLPREAALAEASSPAEIVLAERLRESVTTHKLGEVYSEQGYEDQKYDHGHYERYAKFKENHEDREKSKYSSKLIPENGDASALIPKYYPKVYPQHAADSSNVKVKKSKPGNMQYDTKKYPYYRSAPKNSPVRYATNPDLLPENHKPNSDMPFYESTNYKECPDITPDLNVGPDNKHTPGEPRLKGLGDKIDCLKSKYFGEDPLDNPFFKEESVGSLSEPSSMLLPSESMQGPVLYVSSLTSTDRPITKPKSKKARSNKKKVAKASASSPVVAITEHIEGMLPPPVPTYRVKRDVYSTRRGGVRFSTTDLQSDGSDIDTARLVPSHRVTAGNKFGAREGRASGPRESRGRPKNYEVTELPEEPAGFTASNRFNNRNSPPRRVHVEHHRVTKEEVYSSTYVPEADDEVMTTTVWNAAPSVVEDSFTPRSTAQEETNSLEPQRAEATTDVSAATRAPDQGRSRSRSRTPVAAISEDVFQGRGEKRKGDSPKSSAADTLRSRSRTRGAKPAARVRAEPEEFVTPEPQEAFIVPTEAIPVEPLPTQSYEVVTESVPVERGRQRAPSDDISKVPTDKNTESRGRMTVQKRLKPPVIPNAVKLPSDSQEQEIIPEPSPDRSLSRNKTARPKGDRKDIIRGAGARSPDAPGNFNPRSRNAEPTEQPETRSSPRRTSSRQRSRVSAAEPTETTETSQDTTRRVNRQGASRSGGRRSFENSQPADQSVDTPVAPSRRPSSRRGAPQTAATAPEVVAPSTSSTRRGRPSFAVPQREEEE